MLFGEIAAVVAKKSAQETAKEICKLTKKAGQELAAASAKSIQKDAKWAGGSLAHVLSPEFLNEIHEVNDLPLEIGEKSAKANLPLEIGEEIANNQLPQEIEEFQSIETLPDELYVSEKNLDTYEQAAIQDGSEKNILSNEEKAIIKAETSWSDEIIDHISNMEQYEIYKNADLHEAIINGRKCLLKDIDFEYVDPKTGFTNRELMEMGRTPIDAKTGEKIELHHMGQDFNGPFAELCENSEHGDGNDIKLHDKNAESWRLDPNNKNQYNNYDRPCHWQARAQEV